jgi:hypothetical protein
MGVRVIASTENGMRVHRISANRRRQTPGCGVQTAAGSLEAVFESSDVERFVWILTEVFDQFDEAGVMLHPACHDDPVEFYNLHGFFPDNLRRK